LTVLFKANEHTWQLTFLEGCYTTKNATKYDDYFVKNLQMSSILPFTIQHIILIYGEMLS